MFCITCGKEIPEGGKFCAHCGTRVPIVAVKSSDREISPSKTEEKTYSSMFLKFFLLGILVSGLDGALNKAVETVEGDIVLVLGLFSLSITVFYVYLFSNKVNEAMLSIGKKNWWPLGLLVIIPLGFFIVYFVVRAKLKPYRKWGKDNLLFIVVMPIIAIAILGILASIVLVSVNSARQKARDAKRISDIQVIVLTLDQYFDQYGAYPNTIRELVPRFLSEELTDPASGTSYDYAVCMPDNKAKEIRVHIGANLEDADSPALTEDADYDSSTLGAWTLCDGAWNNGFSGAEPKYDIVR